ncbi:hypothetical protein T439DRAFT_113998 [Meredithblackwellia eburnea MCA 4105]
MSLAKSPLGLSPPELAGMLQEGPTRSLRACLSCRKAKVKCEGTQPCRRCTVNSNSCIFVAPRPTRVPSTILSGAQGRGGNSSSASSHDSPISSNSTLADLANALQKLQRSHDAHTKEIAKLRADLDASAGGASPGSRRKRPRFNSVDSNALAPTPPSITGSRVGAGPGLVALGLVSADQVEPLYSIYVEKVAPRLSILFPAPALNLLAPSSHLMNVVLTLGLRASGPSAEQQHEACLAETRRSLREAQPSSTAEMDDRIHARIHVGLFYNDLECWRHSVIEAHEAGLFTCWIDARTNRLACDARLAAEEGPEELATSERFRMWISCCSMDNFFSMFNNMPPLIQRLDFKATLEESRERLRSGRDVSAWDFYETACLELFEVEVITQEILADFRLPESRTAAETIQKINEMNGALDKWVARWIRTATPAEKDSNGIVITCAIARLYINSFSMRGLEGTHSPTSLDPLRITCIKLGTQSALDIIRTAIRSPMYRTTLPYAIDFVLTNSLRVSSEFLLSVCRAVPAAVDVNLILETLREMVNMLETVGPTGEKYTAHYAKIRQAVDETVVSAAISLSEPQLLPLPTLDLDVSLNGGFDVFDSGDLWQDLFHQSTLAGTDSLGWV